MTPGRARFARVIVTRTMRATKAIGLVGAGAGRDYEATAAEVNALLRKLEVEIDLVRTRYTVAGFDLGPARAIATQAPQGAAPVAAPPTGAPQAPDAPEALPAAALSAAEWGATLASVAAMKWGRVPGLVAAIAPGHMSAVLTQIVARMSDAWDRREGGRNDHAPAS